MRDLVDVFDAIDLALGRADGVLSREELQPYVERAAEIRNRRGFVGETLVLALAGGTGSGKSSLLNALAGEEVSSVSVLRPHTDRPVAWVPEGAGTALDVLMDELGIETRIPQGHFPKLAVVDLPDMDSIADWHRTTVEHLLPRVDVVVWIFDPEKYRDRVIHEDFLAPLAGYREQFVFVLNKVDLLDDEERSIVMTHLLSVLADDGYPDPPLFAVAADPPDAEPIDVGPFAELLRTRLDAKALAIGKLLGDAAVLLRELGHEADIWDGAGLDFEDRWSRVLDTSSSGVVPGSGQASREDALCRIEDFVAAVSVETGGAFGAELRSRFTAEEIEEAVRAAAKAAESAQAGERRRRREPARSRQAAAEELEDRVGKPLRAALMTRARFAASVTYAAAGTSEVAAKLLGRGR